MGAATVDRPPVAVLTATIGLGLAGLFVGMFLGLLSLTLLDAAVGVEFDSPLAIAVGSVAQGVGLVAVALVYLARFDLRWTYLRISRPSLADLIWVVATTIGLFVVFAGILVLIRQVGLTPTEHSVIVAAETRPELLLPLIPLSILVTGPAEELLYRGVIQTRLRDAVGTVRAVLVASAVFAVVHVPAYGASVGVGPELLTTLGILLVLGAVLGAVYERTQNLLVPALAHGLYNATVFATEYRELAGCLGC